MIFTKCIFYALLFVFCLFVPFSEQQISGFPQEVTIVMSSREKRYHHFLWHNIRDNWNRFDSDTQQAITSLGWDPPRPSRTYDDLGKATALFDNDSGEDFLYMHRQMIRQVNDDDQYWHVVGWKTIPDPNDPQWPVQPPYFEDDSSLSRIKSDDFYYSNIQPMEKAFKDKSILQDLTLGELGAYIEITVHNWMHIRFSNISEIGYRPDTSDAMPYIDKMWDDPKYDWLADTYSSHANPIFWKLHGWIDDRIEDWRIANGLSSINWKGTWTGGPMSSLSNWLMKEGKPYQNNDSEAIGDILDKVFKIVAKFGRESRFSDIVNSDFEMKFKLHSKLNEVEPETEGAIPSRKL